MEDKKNKYNLEFKRSRKKYYLEYFCALLLLIALIYAKLKNITLNTNLSYFVQFLILAIFIYTEISRNHHRIKIDDQKIQIIDGVIKEDSKHIFIHSITDIEINQTTIQKLLKYGTIQIRSASGEKQLYLKDVDYPKQIVQKLDKLIEKYKYKKTNDNL